MPQTLLALLALVLASFLTFNQQRLTIRAQTNMLTNEIELAATGLGSEVMEFIAARSFDEQSTPRAVYEGGDKAPVSASQFKAASTFGAADRGASGCDFMDPAVTPECDDVDDVDGTDWTPVTISLAQGRELEFEIRTEVFYVDDAESMTPASGQTLHKRVILDIRSKYVTASETSGLYRTTRVVSYDKTKAVKDFENDTAFNPINGTKRSTAPQN